VPSSGPRCCAEQLVGRAVSDAAHAAGDTAAAGRDSERRGGMKMRTAPPAHTAGEKLPCSEDGDAALRIGAMARAQGEYSTAWPGKALVVVVRTAERAQCALAPSAVRHHQAHD
jgi:hypothetical protein